MELSVISPDGVDVCIQLNPFLIYPHHFLNVDHFDVVVGADEVGFDYLLLPILEIFECFFWRFEVKSALHFSERFYFGAYRSFGTSNFYFIIFKKICLLNLSKLKQSHLIKMKRMLRVGNLFVEVGILAQFPQVIQVASHTDGVFIVWLVHFVLPFVVVDESALVFHRHRHKVCHGAGEQRQLFLHLFPFLFQGWFHLDETRNSAVLSIIEFCQPRFLSVCNSFMIISCGSNTDRSLIN